MGPRQERPPGYPARRHLQAQTARPRQRRPLLRPTAATPRTPVCARNVSIAQRSGAGPSAVFGQCRKDSRIRVGGVTVPQDCLIASGRRIRTDPSVVTYWTNRN
ncbi:hypothetical protein GWI33_013090 [Rhynchophorus ferrugineus]|uniref:Uncharacterized protein n=1 Tax=Rhynchophorus ferrugineus TaxID=354439 RepID=A0A834MDJ5_RHYFE|nr:hypothetical protein GWI33_013090 [Rhynchophorus ferrugineus]